MYMWTRSLGLFRQRAHILDQNVNEETCGGDPKIQEKDAVFVFLFFFFFWDKTHVTTDSCY
jgi:hypothetical protein